MVLAWIPIFGWKEGGAKDRNGWPELHLISYICNVGTSLSMKPCAQAPVYSVCYLAFLRAIVPQDMAICHWLGPLINTAPASHDSSQCTCTHTHAHTQQFRQMGEKVGHVMCEVNRGQGGVSNYGETDCEETDMCLCLSVRQER